MNKSIDLGVLETGLKSNKDFFLRSDDLDVVHDDEANILYVGYHIRFF